MCRSMGCCAPVASPSSLSAMGSVTGAPIKGWLVNIAVGLAGSQEGGGGGVGLEEADAGGTAGLGLILDRITAVAAVGVDAGVLTLMPAAAAAAAVVVGGRGSIGAPPVGAAAGFTMLTPPALSHWVSGPVGWGSGHQREPWACRLQCCLTCYPSTDRVLASRGDRGCGGW